MPRNLDLTALRSFVTVAETGGVTRAAGFLNLTQSAVSMQLKRLEESLDVALLDRSARQIALTPSGEQLLSYARRMLELNDEIYGKLTSTAFEGEIVLGVPHDIIYPVFPQVLQRFAAEYPRVKVQLISSYTNDLKAQFAKGECDLILTTEDQAEAGAERLTTIPLRWIGAPGGSCWRQRPLRIGSARNCRFRPLALAVLDREGVPWEMAVDSESDRTIEATVSADLAVGVMLEGTEPAQLEVIADGGALPTLPAQSINLYQSDAGGPLISALADMIRQAYDAMQPTRIRAVG